MFYCCCMATATTSSDVDTTLQSGFQGSLFGAAPLHCRPVDTNFCALDTGSSIMFEPGWLQGSDQLFETLRTELPWRSMSRPMYDRVVEVPRLICTIELSSLPVEHGLRTVASGLESLLSVSFSTVGANFYRTGNDSVAWHNDRVGRSSAPSIVALVSLGSPRTLAMRRATHHSSQPPKTAETTRSTAATALRWRLGHGDLFVMSGDCQRSWEHSVPKERAVGPRISLAFRA